MKTSFTMDMMGRTLDGTAIKMAPNKTAQIIKMGDMTVFETRFDGTKGYRAQMGQKADMEEDEIKKAKDDKAVIEQLFYNTPDYKLSYVGTEKVGDEEAYKIAVTPPSGKVKTEYYSVKTGFLLKVDEIQESPAGEMNISVTFSDYKKVGDYVMPFTVNQDLGAQQMELKFTDYKFNEGVTDADFQ